MKIWKFLFLWYKANFRADSSKFLHGQKIIIIIIKSASGTKMVEYVYSKIETFLSF